MKFFKKKKDKTDANPIELEDLAKKILLFYFQQWGQPLKKRIEVLNKAMIFVGIKAKFVQPSPDNAGWETEDMNEAERAIQFRKELQKCFPLGQFEWEVSAIKDVLMKYKGGRK